MYAESAPDGVLVTDAAGRIAHVYGQSERLFGYARSELVGQAHEILVPERLRAAHRAHLVRYLADPKMRSMGTAGDLLGRRKDGSEFPIEVSLSPLDESGRLVVLSTIRDVTARRQTEDALRASEARFRGLTELSADWYWEQDEKFRFVATGSEDSSLIRAGRLGLTRWEGVDDGNDPKWDRHRALLAQHLPFRDFEYSRASADGVHRHVSVSGMPIFRANGAFKGYRGVGRDITERKTAEDRIRSLNRVYAMLSGINSLIVRVRERQELFRAACHLAVEQGGFRMAWIGVLDRDSERLHLVASAGAVGDFFAAAPLGVVEARPDGRGLAGRALRERKPMVSNDVAADPDYLMKPHCAERGIGSVAVLPLIVEETAYGVLALYAERTGFFDPQEMKLLQELADDIAFAVASIARAERIHYLAYYDALTGLANRSLLLERLAQALGGAGGGAALLVLNIDRFRTINDAYGRHAGDRVLREIAQRLRDAVGDESRLARSGPDSFAILAPQAAREEDTARLAARLLAELERPIRLAEAEFAVAGKIGIAVAPDDAREADALFHRAEASVKKAKELGDRYLFYTRAMSERTAEKLALEARLRRALDNDEFVLHYQPKVASASGRITGLEALIRWRSPELGLVPPMQFIPLMEETGLILEAGSWALRRAALDHRAWSERNLAPPRVAVNVSAIQLRQRDFVESVERAIMNGVAAVGLDLEITESLLMQDVAASAGKLARLRSLGLRIAIDDFGTGYSSLAYLARLPVQAMKIDRSFVITMLEKPEVMTLVETIIGLARSLRLVAIAEGGVSEPQAQRLRALGCDEMQGYLFGRPLDFDAIIAVLENSRRSTDESAASGPASI